MNDLSSELILKIAKHLIIVNPEDYKRDFINFSMANQYLRSVLEYEVFYKIVLNHEFSLKKLLEFEDGAFLKRIGQFIKRLTYYVPAYFGIYDFKLFPKLFDSNYNCSNIKYLNITAYSILRGESISFSDLQDSISLKKFKNFQSVTNVYLCSIAGVGTKNKSNLKGTPTLFSKKTCFNTHSRNDQIPEILLNLFPNIKRLTLRGFKFNSFLHFSNKFQKLVIYDCDIFFDLDTINSLEANKTTILLVISYTRYRHQCAQNLILNLQELLSQFESIQHLVLQIPKSTPEKTLDGALERLRIVDLPLLGDQLKKITLFGFDVLKKKGNNPFSVYRDMTYFYSRSENCYLL